jgi:hypothetical protein
MVRWLDLMSSVRPLLNRSTTFIQTETGVAALAHILKPCAITIPYTIYETIINSQPLGIFPLNIILGQLNLTSLIHYTNVTHERKNYSLLGTWLTGIEYL